jgi:hypothetical protein
VANSLTDIVSFLYKAEEPQSIDQLFGLREPGYQLSVARALMAAELWNLISVTSSHHRFGSAHDADLKVQLTQTGEDWNLASAQYQPTHNTERKSMGNARKKSPTIHIGNFSGVFNVAGQNIPDQNNNITEQAAPSDAQLLSFLAEVLRLQQVPWTSPDLVDVRYVLEEAVNQRNPRISGLKQAVIKLRAICGDVIIGVLGNEAFQLLQHFKY